MNRAEAPKIKKESKNKIRVDFDRTPLLQRLRAKFLNLYTPKKCWTSLPTPETTPNSSRWRKRSECSDFFRYCQKTACIPDAAVVRYQSLTAVGNRRNQKRREL